MPVSSSTPRTRSRSPHRALTTAKDVPKMTSFDFEVTDMARMPITLKISATDVEKSESHTEESERDMGQEIPDISSGVVTGDTLIRKLSEALHGIGKDVPVPFLSLNGFWKDLDDDNLMPDENKKPSFVLMSGDIRKEVKTDDLMSGRLWFTYCIWCYDFKNEEWFCDCWFDFPVGLRKAIRYFRELDLLRRLEALTGVDVAASEMDMLEPSKTAAPEAESEEEEDDEEEGSEEEEVGAPAAAPEIGEESDEEGEEEEDDDEEEKDVMAEDGESGEESSEDGEKGTGKKGFKGKDGRAVCMLGRNTSTEHLTAAKKMGTTVEDHHIYLWPIKVLLYMRDYENALAERVERAAMADREFEGLFDGLKCEKPTVFSYMSELSVADMFGSRPESPNGCEVLRSYVDCIFSNAVLTHDFMKYLFQVLPDVISLDAKTDLISRSRRYLDGWFTYRLEDLCCCNSEDQSESIIPSRTQVPDRHTELCEKFDALCVDLIQLFFTSYVTRFVIPAHALDAGTSRSAFDSNEVLSALWKSVEEEKALDKPSHRFVVNIIRTKLVDARSLLSEGVA